MTEDSILANIRSRLSTQFDLEQIVLFGSRATGRSEAHSDWDVLVIANSSIPFIERQGQALSVIGPHDYPLDLLLYTPDEASAALAIPGSAVYWAEREGKVVYAKQWVTNEIP